MNPKAHSNPTVLRLDEYFLTKLEMGWEWGEGDIQPNEITTSFDYDLAVNKDDARSRRMVLKVGFQESSDGAVVGHRIYCEIVGFFSFTEQTPVGKEELQLRINGVSILYGALRGILMAVVGAFPGRGAFRVPNIMPQQVVQDIERRKASMAQSPKTKEASAVRS